MESALLAQTESSDQALGLPTSVRYIKNGAGGKWWRTALKLGQVHAGWSDVPRSILEAADFEAARLVLYEWAREHAQPVGVATRDFNALKLLIDRPSQHLWVTFADRRMWWCTVKDHVETNPDDQSDRCGHFWLTCDRPWSDRSLDGQRQLFISDLPGSVAAAAGYRATVCKPDSADVMLRLIHGGPDPYVTAVRSARQLFKQSVANLISQLGDRDFEQLVDLILARDGWVRIARVGGVGADIDIEVENRSADEIAFVQVKSRGNQAVLDDYVYRFENQRDRYARMIFAVHRIEGAVIAPSGIPVQIWDRERIADLVVRLGLADWLEGRV